MNILRKLESQSRVYACLFYVVFLSCIPLRGQDSTLQYLGTLLSDSAKLEWLNVVANKAVHSNPEQTFRLAEIYDSIATLQDDDVYNAKANNLYGMAHYVNGLYGQAADYYLRAIAIVETTNEKGYLGQLFNNLATTYRFREDNSKSIEYYLKAMDIAVELKDTVKMATLSNNLGMQYVESDDYSSAMTYYNLAIDMFSKSGQAIYEGITYLSRGNLRIEMEDYPKAISDYDSAMDLVPESAVPLLHAASVAGIGSAYNRMGQSDRAEPLLLSSLEKAKAIQHTEQLKESHRELSELYERKKDLGKALYHHKQYKSANDEMLTTEQDEAMVDALTKYEAEKNQQEIALLESQNEIANLKLTASRRRGLLFGLGLLGFAGISFWLFQLYKRIQSQNSIISKALSEKETLLKEIHHRVKNNLQFISSLLRLQTGHVKDSVALDALQEGQDRVQSMALIHQNLYQEDNLTGVDMRAYFNKLIRGLFNSYNIHDERIQLELDIADVNLDVDTVIPLGLIVNELISNSLKYAFPDDRSGKIKVSLDRQKETLLLRVEDDGVGISDTGQEKMSTSFGYKLINAFSRQLDADMSVDGSDGTKVEFKISSFELAA